MLVPSRELFDGYQLGEAHLRQIWLPYFEE